MNGQRALTWEAWIGPLLLAVMGGILATVPQAAPASRGVNAAGAQLVKEQSAAETFVHARAWEDPLLAVSAAPPSSNEPAKDPALAAPSGGESTSQPVRMDAHDVQSLRDKIGETKGRLTIILQELSGGPGLEDEESRRQFRMASTLALMSCGFEPRTPASEIGRLKLEQPVHPGIGRALAYQLMLRKDECCVLVFIPDQLLNDFRSLDRCVTIATALAPEGRSGTRALILRMSSQALINDINFARNNGVDRDISFAVLNTGSTASLKEIFQEKNEDIGQWTEAVAAREAGDGRSVLAPIGGWNIGRVLGSDQRLIDILVKELDLRRAGLASPRNAIAVVCEVDSPYGKAFASAFQEAAARSGEPVADGDQAAETGEWNGAFDGSTGERADKNNPRIKIIRFMAGLDIPPRSESGRKAYGEFKEEMKRLKDERIAVTPISPLGQRHTDYVYRHLAEFDRELRLRGQQLSAVVLCAFDAFDKRPLIQLIRGRFPDVVIATTDMNALLTDQNDWSVMRNLIVATHLELSLSDRIQGDYAPFRSCYQTSLFLGVKYAMTAWPDPAPSGPAQGVKRALDVVESDHADWIESLNATVPSGRVYEIGSDGPVLLDTARPAAADDAVFYPTTRVIPTRVARIGGWVREWWRALAPERASLNAVQSAPNTVVLCALLAVVLMVFGVSQPDAVFFGSVLAVAMVAGLFVYLDRACALNSSTGLLLQGLAIACCLGALARATLRGRWRRGEVLLDDPWLVGWAASRVRFVWFCTSVVVALLAIVPASLIRPKEVRPGTWADPDVYLFGALGVMGLVTLGVMTWQVLGPLKQARQSAGDVHKPSPARASNPTNKLKKLGEWAFAEPWSTMHGVAGLCLLVLCLVTLIGLLCVLTGSGVDGEPWGWINGVSAWPSEIIRLTTVLVGMLFLLKCVSVHRSLWKQACVDELLKGSWSPAETGDESPSLMNVSAVVWPVPFVPQRNEPPDIKPAGKPSAKMKPADLVDVGVVLRQFRDRCRLRSTAVRICLLALLVMCISLGAIAVVEAPRVPVRGSAAFAIHVTLMGLSIAVLNAVVLVVWDAGHLCSRFVRLLAYGRSHWPEAHQAVAQQYTGVSSAYVDSWLDVRSIGRVTRAVNGLIYWPVLLIILSALAWHRDIDGWPFSWLLVLFNGLSLSVCVLAAWTLRRASEAARRGEIQHLMQSLAELDRQDEKEYSECESLLDPRNNRKLSVMLEFGPNSRNLYVEQLWFEGNGRHDRNGVEPRTAMNIVSWIHDNNPQLAQGAKVQSTRPGAGPRPALQQYRNQRVELVVQSGGRAPTLEVLPKDGPRTSQVVSQPCCAEVLDAIQSAATEKTRLERRHKAREARAAQVRSLVQQIQEVREGAFAPWTEDPLFRGVVVPALGFVSVKFAEWVNLIAR